MGVKWGGAALLEVLKTNSQSKHDGGKGQTDYKAERL